MPPAHRKGDIGSGHGCYFPPSSATGGSLDVNIDGIPAMRVGDRTGDSGSGTSSAPPLQEECDADTVS